MLIEFLQVLQKAFFSMSTTITPEISSNRMMNYTRKCYDDVFIFEVDSLVFALITNPWELSLEVGQGNKQSFEVSEEYYLVNYRKSKVNTDRIVSAVLNLIQAGKATKESLIDLVLCVNFRKSSFSPMIASVTRTFTSMPKITQL